MKLKDALLYLRSWYMAKIKGRGRAKHDEVIQSVTLTPEDLGVMSAGQSKDSLIAVVTNVGTRAPKSATITTTLPLVTAVFVPPNIARITMGTPTVAVDEPFEFEVDAL